MQAIKTIIFLSFLICLSALNAQQKQIDSIIQIIQITKEDSLKLKYYLNILELCETKDNLKYGKIADSIINKIELEKKIGPQKIKNITYLRVLIYDYIFQFYKNLNDNYNAEIFLLKKHELIMQSNKLVDIRESVEDIGVFYVETNIILKGVEFFTEKIRNDERNNKIDNITWYFHGISTIYSQIKNFNKALEYELKRLDSRIKIKDVEEYYVVFLHIADCYFNLKEYNNANLYYLKAEENLKKFANNNGEIILCRNIAKTYSELKKYNKAKYFYYKSIDIALKTNSEFWLCILFSELGQTFFYEKNIVKAIELKLKALSIIKNKELYHEEFIILASLSEIYFSQNKYTLALKYAEKANKIIDKNMIREQKEIFELISKIYIKLNKIELSNKYLVRYYELKDKIDLIDNSESLLLKELNYQNEKNEFKFLSEQKIKDQKSKEEKQKQKIILWFTLGGLIIITFFSISIFNKFKVTQKQKKIITEQKQEVEKQKEVVEEQNHLIKEKQKEILDSIHYAKRLQEAILPPLKFIDEHVPNNFVLYQPKDVVAGDFYWAETKDNKFFIAAADCTGHGVPGAMVSVVCSNALNRTVNEFGITDTGKILDKTRELVLETFAKGNSEVKDGMDISLLCIDKSNNKVYWSGANNPLWYVKSSVTSSAVEKSTDTGLDTARPDIQLIEIKADKQPIGKSEITKPFTAHEIALQDGMQFYLFTDGFPDQFGGPKGKKFMYKQLENLLISISHESMEIQKQKLENVFKNWKGDLEQVDDVCMIGVRI